MSSIVVAACRLVGRHNGVRRVHIEAGGRPAQDELYRYREPAQTHRVRLTVNGQRLIAVRPEERPGGGREMSTGEIVAGLIGIALLVYLVYALLAPEKF